METKQKKTIICALVVLAILSQMADAVQMQLDLTMTPTAILAPGVFGYYEVPNVKFYATFYFDDDDDVDILHENLLQIPYGMYTLEGDWGDAIGAGWDETMGWTENHPFEFDIVLIEFPVGSWISRYYENPLGNQIQFGYPVGDEFRMIDVFTPGNNQLLGTIVFYLHPVDPMEKAMQDLEEALDFFVESVEYGTISSVRSGHAGEGQLGALWNMIVEAGVFIEAGQLEDACLKLQDALGKCDGLGPPNSPPDFIEGPDAAELANMIQELIDSLGCLINP